jgi:hypothetical protein
MNAVGRMLQMPRNFEQVIRTLETQMSPSEAISLLVALAVLAGYLYIKHRQRKRSRQEWRAPAEWTGHGIDVNNLMPRVENLRSHHLSFRKPAREHSFRGARLDSARANVTRLGFFRRVEPHDDLETRRFLKNDPESAHPPMP